MADIVLDTQGTPTTPAAGTAVAYFDSVTKKLCFRDDTGRVFSVGGAIRNWSIADQLVSAADNYLVGSALAVPPHLLQVGTMFRWTVCFSKTAAGTAATTFMVRVGTAGAVGDTARLTFTLPASTAAVDQACVEIIAILRNLGAAGVLAGSLRLSHNTPGTDLAAGAGIAGLSSTPILMATSAGFDTTVPSTIVGLSTNPGTGGAHTHQIVQAEMLNI